MTYYTYIQCSPLAILCQWCSLPSNLSTCDHLRHCAGNGQIHAQGEPDTPERRNVKLSDTHKRHSAMQYQPAFARVTRSLIDSRTIRVPTGPDLALIITAAIPIQTRVWITPPLDIRIDAVFDRGGSHR